MKRSSRVGALALCAGSLVLAGLVTAGAAGASSGVRTRTLSLLPTAATEVARQAHEVVTQLTLPEVAADHARVVDHAATVAAGSDDTTSTEAETETETEAAGDDAGAAPAIDATGPQTWSGVLCDGTTAASIAYVVEADGTISGVAPTPATASVHQESNKGVTVSFSHQERVQIRVHSSEDGTVQVRVKEKLRCEAVANDAPSTTADDHGSDATDDQGHDATEDANDDNGSGQQGADDSADNSAEDSSSASGHGGSDHGSDKHGGSSDDGTDG